MDIEAQEQEQRPLNPQPQAQPTEIQKENPWRHVIIGLGIIATLLIVLICYFVIIKHSKENKVNIIPSNSPSISPTPTQIQPNNTSTWKTYIDSQNHFEFKYPADYPLTQWGIQNTPVLNHNIMWLLTMKPEECKVEGNCGEKTTINGFTAFKISGVLATEGGSIPQSYISYYILNPRTNYFFGITLYEVPLYENSIELDKKYPMNRKPGPISQEEQIVFDKIVSSFQFITN